MASKEEVDNLRKQITDLNQEVEMLKNEVSLELVDENKAMKIQIEQLQEQAKRADTVVAELKDIVARASAKMKDQVDLRDVVQPTMFTDTEDSFYEWHLNMIDAICARFKKLRPIMQWASEQDEEIKMDEAKKKLAEVTNENPEDIMEKLLMMLRRYTSGNAKELCRKTKQNGLEAWRALRVRYSPKIPQAKRDLTNKIMNPERVTKLEELMAHITTWENHQLRYKQLTGSDQTEEQKMYIVGTMCPSDLQHHLNVTGASYKEHAEVRKEIERYIDSRKAIGTTTKKVACIINAEEGDIMHNEARTEEQEATIYGLGKNGGKGYGKQQGQGKGGQAGEHHIGKGGSKPPIECWNCGGPHPQALCPKGKGKGYAKGYKG